MPARARAHGSTAAGGRGRALPRGRRGGRPPRRRGAPLHAEPATAATRRSSTIPDGARAGLGGAREPERRRADRLGRRRLGVRRPRRTPPRGGGSHGSLARRRLGGADADGRHRRAAGLDRRRDAGRARPLRRRAPPYARAAVDGHERRARAGRARIFARRGIRDERVLAAMAAVPRELFVPERAASARVRGRGAADRARPDDLAAVHGRDDLRAARRSTGGERVLDVGTGSGYQAAVLAELAAEVVTIERVPELAERRARTLRGRLRARRGARRGRHARRARARAVRRDRRRRRGAGRPARSTTSSRRGGRLVVPVGSRRDQRLEARRPRPEGPGGRGARCRAASCRCSAPRDSARRRACG